MLKILCLCKWVVDEAYIRSDSSGRLDFSTVEYRMNEYDRNALEEAVRLKKEYEADTTAVTVTIPEHRKAIKDALSRGADRACFIANPDYVDLEPAQTAAILAAVIKEQVPFDLILCGEGSSDLYASQVGSRLARSLGIPSISSVRKIDIQNGEIVAERKNLNTLERVALPMPCLIAVSPDINIPRIPGIKDTLAASKKPVEEVEDLPLAVAEKRRVNRLSLKYARMERNVQMLPADANGIQELARILLSESRKGG